MLVKFKNTGPATRILFDIAAVQRQVKPGVEIEIDLPRNQVVMFEHASELGQPVQIERLESEEEAQDGEPERQSEPRETFTLRPEENPQMEPQSLKEALGQGSTLRPDPTELPPEPVLVQHHNPIQHQAEVNALEDRDGEASEAEQEPTKASEVLALIEAGSLSAEDQVRLSNKVLPKRLPRGVKPQAIIEKLQAQAATE